jgi:cobalt-zinc-cadmium efflux system protein
VAVIAVSTWGLFRESLDLALDAVPISVDTAEVERYLSKVPGIAAVHDLHVWAMSTTEPALTVHLIKPDGRLDDELLAGVASELRARFGIEHVTIQLERGADHGCNLAPLPESPST